MNILAYLDGEKDLIEIANTIKMNALDILPIITKLSDLKIIEKCKNKKYKMNKKLNLIKFVWDEFKFKTFAIIVVFLLTLFFN